MMDCLVQIIICKTLLYRKQCLVSYLNIAMNVYILYIALHAVELFFQFIGWYSLPEESPSVIIILNILSFQ